MIKNIITLCIVFFFILSLSSCYFSPDDNELVQKNITVEQSDNITVDRSGKTIDTVDTIDVIQKITFPEAMLLGVNMEVVSSIVGEEQENSVFFEVMYDGFRALKTYDDYKKYIEKFPELLPVIYAVKLQDKENYLKFYSFIFDKVYDDKIYISDIETQFGSGPQEETKEKFLKALGDHYEVIIADTFTFDPSFGDGPIHIALTNDSMETVKKNCDASGISGDDENSKKECYDYAYQYRATLENKYCEQVESLFQKRACLGFFEYSNN